MKYKQTFDNKMGNPLEAIDNLIQQAHEMKEKKVLNPVIGGVDFSKSLEKLMKFKPETHTVIVHDEEDFSKTKLINF